MKRILTLAAAAMLLTATAYAQDKTESAEKKVARPANEVALSYGVITLPDFALTFGALFASAFTAGYASPDKMNTTGAISVEYFHYLHPHFAVGAMMDWELYNLSFKSRDGKDENGNPVYKPGSTEKLSFTSIMPAVKAPWFNRRSFGMYSKVAGGMSLVYTTEKKPDGSKVERDDAFSVNWAAQINPIGMEFGNGNVRGFMEIGWGMQGLLMGGVKYAF